MKKGEAHSSTHEGHSQDSHWTGGLPVDGTRQSLNHWICHAVAHIILLHGIVSFPLTNNLVVILFISICFDEISANKNTAYCVLLVSRGDTERKLKLLYLSILCNKDQNVKSQVLH